MYKPESLDGEIWIVKHSHNQDLLGLVDHAGDHTVAVKWLQSGDMYGIVEYIDGAVELTDSVIERSVSSLRNKMSFPKDATRA